MNGVLVRLVFLRPSDKLERMLTFVFMRVLATTTCHSK